MCCSYVCMCVSVSPPSENPAQSRDKTQKKEQYTQQSRREKKRKRRGQGVLIFFIHLLHRRCQWRRFLPLLFKKQTETLHCCVTHASKSATATTRLIHGLRPRRKTAVPPENWLNRRGGTSIHGQQQAHLQRMSLSAAFPDVVSDKWSPSL